MTHFSDPAVVEQDLSVLKNFWHTTNGLYIWEYLTTLDFELDIIRGRRPYRWTIWIYSLTRTSTLMAIILNFVALDTMTPINCQLWITFELIFGSLGLVAASLLIVFRIIAIWNRNKLVVGIAAIAWVTNVSVIILGIVRLRSVWEPALRNCIVLNTEENKPNIIVTLITDITLLLMVLVGLLRLFHGGGGSFALGRLLWKQGVIWLLIATVAEVPPTVFIILNLNGSLNILFQLPSVITMSIAATRMHRILADFVFGSTDITIESDNKDPRTKLDHSPSIPVTLIEGAVDTPCERHPTAPTIISMGRQLGDKARESSLDSDLERAMENRVPG